MLKIPFITLLHGDIAGRTSSRTGLYEVLVDSLMTRILAGAHRYRCPDLPNRPSAKKKELFDSMIFDRRNTRFL